jgi:hypothetical protein
MENRGTGEVVVNESGQGFLTLDNEAAELFEKFALLYPDWEERLRWHLEKDSVTIVIVDPNIELGYN